MEKQVGSNKLANRNAATLVACIFYCIYKYTHVFAFFSNKSWK